MSGTTIDTPPPAIPNPFDAGATGPWAGPPETWQDLADRDDGREVVLSFGASHNAAVQSLLDLRDAHGGGLRGLVHGTLLKLQDHGLVTETDAGRLDDLVDAVLATGSNDQAMRDNAHGRVATIHQAILADPQSSLPALAVTSVATASLDMWSTRQAHDHSAYSQGYAEGAAVTAADTAGAVLGCIGGGAGAFVACMSASALVATTEVSVTVSFS